MPVLRRRAVVDEICREFIKSQVAFLLLGPMTSNAMRLKDRQDISRKIAGDQTMPEHEAYTAAGSNGRNEVSGMHRGGSKSGGFGEVLLCLKSGPAS